MSPPNPPWGRVTAPYQSGGPPSGAPKRTKTYGKSMIWAFWSSWGSSKASGGLQMPPKRPKTAPGRPKMAPRGPQKNTPMTPQEGPKRTPRSASSGQNHRFPIGL
eukprot:5987041-Pyramimonas_sp.AAC.1